jgi:Sec-independent protein translocase protein TatA
MPTWLIVVIVVLILLAAGGMYARTRQLARTRPAFERSLERVDRDLAQAAASDRGWDRALLEAAARRIAAERHGSEPETLVLVEVLDRPGTDEDEAVFEIHLGGRHHRLVLGRREGDWVASEQRHE